MVASVSSINQQHPISRNDGGNPVVEDAGQDMAGDDERLFQRPNAGRFLLTGAQKVLYERRTEQRSGPCFAEFPNVCVAVGVRVDVFALLDIG